MVKIVLVVLILGLAAGCACAKVGEPMSQLSVGAYFITDSASNFDPDTGWALSYFHLAERNWYTSIEVGRYSASISFPPEPITGQTSAETDVTTWLVTIGRAVRSRDGKSYLGAGIGWLADDDVDLGHGVRFESSTHIGWELVAGTARQPLGVQVRYHDGGMAPNRGVTVALSYSW